MIHQRDNENAPGEESHIPSISFDELVQLIIKYQSSIDDIISINHVDDIWHLLDWADEFNPPFERSVYLTLYCRFYRRIMFAKKLDELIRLGFEKYNTKIVASCFDHVRHLGFLPLVAQCDYEEKVYTLVRTTSDTHLLDVYVTFVDQKLEKGLLYQRENFELRTLKVRLETLRMGKKNNELFEYLSNCVPYNSALHATTNVVFTEILNYVENASESELHFYATNTLDSDVSVLLAVLCAMRLKMSSEQKITPLQEFSETVPY